MMPTIMRARHKNDGYVDGNDEGGRRRRVVTVYR